MDNSPGKYTKIANWVEPTVLVDLKTVCVLKSFGEIFFNVKPMKSQFLKLSLNIYYIFKVPRGILMCGPH